MQNRILGRQIFGMHNMNMHIYPLNLIICTLERGRWSDFVCIKRGNTLSEVCIKLGITVFQNLCAVMKSWDLIWISHCNAKSKSRTHWSTWGIKRKNRVRIVDSKLVTQAIRTFITLVQIFQIIEMILINAQPATC